MSLQTQLSKVMDSMLREKPARTRALIVDDSPIVQKVHKFFLEREGCEVDVVDCAEHALLLEPNRYQIIFVDLNLPGMSGIELAAEIRRRERTLQFTTRIIGISAAATESGNMHDCLTAGINELLPKPVSAQQVSEILKRWLNLQ